MTDHSVYATYPDTLTTNNDGVGITVETAFYVVGVSGWRVKGVKLFVPAGSAAIGKSVTLAAWVPGVAGSGLGGTSQGSGTVTLVAGWNQVTFTPVTLTAGVKFGVSYTSSDGYYFTGTNPTPPTQAADGSALYESESDSGAGYTPQRRGAYRYANASAGDFAIRSGLDAITDDGSSSTTTGSVSASTPKLTSSIAGTMATTGSLSASTPRLTSNIAGSSAKSVVDENAVTTGAQPKAFWFEGVTSEAVPGFARSSYFQPGQTARFSVDYNQAFTVSVWRLGHYQGNGARQVASFAGTPTAQPSAVTIPNSNGAVTCTAWSENVTWDVPADATPGWYQLLLAGQPGAFGHVLFCVTDKLVKKKTLIVASDLTWGAAYNGYGNNNVYGASKGIGNIADRALCSSLDKPVISRDNVPQTHFFNANYPYLKWSESMGIDAGYTTIEQINNDPTILDGRDQIIFTGHNEYVTQNVVSKVKALLAVGSTNVINIAGNDMFWRVTLGGTTFPSGSTGSSTGRVMWCKKDTMSGPSGSGHTGGTAFTTQADWTGSWQDTRWALREPPAEYLGDRFVANGIRSDQVKVPFAMKGSPAWRSCAGVQALTSGQVYSFAAGTLGMEWDVPVAGGPSQKSFSESTVDLTGNTADVNGELYNLDSTQTHSFTMGRSPGGSFIANLNSDQWPWALDALHLRSTPAADTNAQQMMLNLLVDLGVVPSSSSVSAASLTMPTKVSNVATAYEIPEGSVTGGIAGATPRPTSSISGVSLTVGSVNAALPSPTSAIAGQSITVGSVAASLPRLTSSISGAGLEQVTGTLSADLSKLTSSIDGVSYATITGQISASTPRLASSISGTGGAVTGSIAAVLSLLRFGQARLLPVAASMGPRRSSPAPWPTSGTKLNVYARESTEFQQLGVTVGGVDVSTFEYAVARSGSRPTAWAAPISIEGQTGFLVSALQPGLHAVWVRYGSNPDTPVFKVKDHLLYVT